jgi:hypothetical protein
MGYFRTALARSLSAALELDQQVVVFGSGKKWRAHVRRELGKLVVVEISTRISTRAWRPKRRNASFASWSKRS